MTIFLASDSVVVSKLFGFANNSERGIFLLGTKVVYCTINTTTLVIGLPTFSHN